jgi:hypothetical protein
MSTANKLIGSVSANKSNIDVYLDTAAELSKLDRKNHLQVAEDGKPLVYDLLVTVSTPSTADITAPDKQLLASGTVSTAPNNWQTRNAVRMAHFTRQDLRREAGVSKGAIGKYAKSVRMNLDNNMFDIAYSPQTSIPAPSSRYQRLYAFSDVSSTPSHSATTAKFKGGVWDYSQLAQVETDDANAVTDYYLTVLGNHVGTPSAGYTTVSCIQAYNERRQTTRDDSTVNAGGDTQFIDNDSPFFRVPQQDASEDSYVEITLDEQDNPPYDRRISGDALKAQPQEYFQLSAQSSQVSFRIQAPLGLVKFEFTDLYGTGWVEEPNSPESLWTIVQDLFVEVECLGTYEM